MKNKRTKRAVSLLTALLLAVTMLTVLAAPTSAAALSDIKETLDANGDGEIKYLALGSAHTVGSGVAAGQAYPELVKAALSDTGKTVSLQNLGLSGMRAEELRYLLDSNYSGDAYTEEKFLGNDGIFAAHGGAEALREKYINAVREAEVITLELGFDSFLTYALDYAFNSEYEADFSMFDDGLARSAEEIKGRFEDVLNGYIEDGDSPETGVLLQRVIDGVAYAIVGYADNFDAVLANIYKLNPDAQLTVLNIKNPLEGLEATMSGLDFQIPLSLIYGIIVDVANIYMGTLSAYDGAYNFAYVGEGKTDMLDSSASDNAVLGEIIKTAEEYSVLDLTAAATTEKDARSLVNSILAASSVAGFDLKTNPDYIALISDTGAMTKLAIAVRCGYGQLPALPSAQGHKTIAASVVSAMANSTKGADVIKNDMNEVYSLLLEYLDRDTLLDLEYTFSPHYVLDPQKSYYVALGDGSAADRNGYVKKLADSLSLSDRIPAKNKYKNLAIDGETPASLLEKIMKIGTMKEEDRKAIMNADLFTISFNNAATTKYMFEQFIAAATGGTPAVHDWAKLLDTIDPTLSSEVEGVKTMLKEELVKSLGDEKTAEMVVTAVESYAYSYLSRLVSYPMLVDQIHTVNRKAMVVIVGAYNDMAGVTINLGGEILPLGNYIQYLIDVANLESLIYSALSEKTAYVACPKIDTKMGKVDIDLSNLSISEIGKLTKFTVSTNYNPTAEGHEMIADAVVDNLTIVAPHTCVYDHACDNRCDICKAKRTTKGHIFSSPCTEECEVEGCSARNSRPALHDYDAPCDESCSVCGKARDAADHAYTGVCDTLCDSCGITRAAEASHSFGEWKNGSTEKSRACSVCGTVEREELAAEDNTVIVIVAVIATAAVLGGGGAAAYFLVIKKKLPKAEK